MLLGRTAELEQLNHRYASGTAACLVLYGHRGVGKTALLRAFLQDKPAIFFSAVSGTALDNVKALSQAIHAFQSPHSVHAPYYRRLDDALSAITALAQSQRLILVIDNLSYLADAEPDVLPKLQHLMDGPWGEAKLFLILCSSSQRFVERDVLGPSSPLAARADPMKLLPLSYREAACWYPDQSPAENALLYGITGGIPLYLNKLQGQDSVRDMLLEHLFDPASYLFAEPERLLRQELRDLNLYNSVLTSMAGGAERLQEIAAQTGTDTAACIKYIDVLTAMGIVEKLHPVPQESRRKTRYTIADHFFRFWYRFVPGNLQRIAAGTLGEFYPGAVEEGLEAYMAPVFQDLCRQHLMHTASDLPFPIQEIGTWWGRDPKSRQEIRIDIVATGPEQRDQRRESLFAGCRYADTPMDVEDLYRLRSHAALLADHNHACRFYLFSKAGFSGALLERQRLGEVRLVSLEEMYQF